MKLLVEHITASRSLRDLTLSLRLLCCSKASLILRSCPTVRFTTRVQSKVTAHCVSPQLPLVHLNFVAAEPHGDGLQVEGEA